MAVKNMEPESAKVVIKLCILDLAVMIEIFSLVND